MKSTKSVCGVLLVSFSILVACGDNNDQSLDGNVDNDSEIDDTQVEGSSEGLTSKRNSSSDDVDTEEDLNPDLSEGETEDQLDLRIGDTGKIETNLNVIEVTLNDVSLEEEINGEMPERDYFYVADITLKNLADEKADIAEALDVLEIASSLDGSGGSDYSHYYNAIEPMEGELESGQEIRGQLLFEEDDFEEYFIRVSLGLVAAEGAKNQAIWTFMKDEAE
ncbi:hypothetical protein ACTHQ4_14925 [Alkalicoccobacillus gibsonii]|uniref:hypothetical protein n=1 Tax=Alkalicoccobacillus gibsonii TaxID=79881 RepID=UPI003F7C1B7F